MAVSLEFLSSVRFLSQLSLQELGEVALQAKEKEFSTGQAILLQDEPCQGLYIVQDGRVKISRYSLEGRELMLHLAGQRDFFGGASVFCGCACPATATSLEPTRVIVLAAADLLELANRHPWLSVRVMTVCCARMRQLSALVRTLSARNIHRRLAWLLMSLAEGPSASLDGLIPCSRMTQREMAARLGTNQETIARSLSRMRELGVVSSQGRGIAITDMARLRRIAHGWEAV